MRKRLIKRRKRIKGSANTAAERERAVCRENKKANNGEAKRGGALTLYERGEIERSIYDTPEEEITAENAQEMSAAAPERLTEGKREEILRLVCGFVVIFSLFSAVVLTCFAFAVATEYSERDKTEDVLAEAGTEENGKIIFIHTDGNGNGLTAPEIYEKCSRSAVSILSEYAETGESVGSGFVVSSDGYIATAAHVISGAESVWVILANKEEYEARIVAADSLSDLALLKIDGAEGLVAAELGESSTLLAGERVYAIGTPASLDYAGSLTSGEVSCAERTLYVYGEGVKALEKKLKVIQINADVNKGNSGCPLFDCYGRVVGMVTMKLGADYSGIGFALPSEGIAPVFEAMREGKELSDSVLSGVVLRPAKLGITCHTEERDGIWGCLVDSVSGNGALKVGDLIIQIDNKLVSKSSDINGIMESRSPGDTVKITLMRSGQRLTFDIVLSGKQ